MYQNQFNYELIPQNVQTLGKLIKIMRLSRGYTQLNLANALDTCRQHIQKWEYEICKPSPEHLDKLLDVLKYRSTLNVIRQYYI